MVAVGQDYIAETCINCDNWVDRHPSIDKTFKCTKCGKQGNGGGILQVHHDKERFSEIVNSHAEKLNWYQELQDAGYDLTNDNIILLKTKISEAVMDYHIKNDVSGIVLCKFCHKKEHKSYNFI